jgi:predicted metal-dependent HD superfamily phosphohydrolase
VNNSPNNGRDRVTQLHQVYCEERAEVLKGFLEHLQIYGTKVMGDALETRAQDNLKAEIESLQNLLFPK